MTGVCSVEDCDQPTEARGLCHRHYRRAWRNGTLPPKRVFIPPVCTEPACGQKAIAKGLCSHHYYAVRRPRKPPRVRTVPVIDRLMRNREITEDGCWLWTSNVNVRWGYGQMRVDNRTRRVHRVAYELLVGPIPEGHDLDHTCHNADLTCPGGITCRHRLCFNPDHLLPSTRRDNLGRAKVRRAAARAAREAASHDS